MCNIVILSIKNKKEKKQMRILYHAYRYSPFLRLQNNFQTSNFIKYVWILQNKYPPQKNLKNHFKKYCSKLQNNVINR